MASKIADRFFSASEEDVEWAYGGKTYKLYTRAQNPTEGRVPVFRIVIRYPVYDTMSQSITVREREIVNTMDTSIEDIRKRAERSPVSGIWIDRTNTDADPDKAQIQIQNPIDPNGSTKGWVSDDAIACRNWVDIWIGYRPQTQFAFDRGNTNNKLFVKDAIPEAFDFGSRTHLFSGQIVGIDRQVSSSGDRISLTAFSPSYVLRSIKAYDQHRVWGLTTAKTIEVGGEQKEVTVDIALKSIFASIHSITNRPAAQSGESSIIELLKKYYDPTSEVPLLRAGQIPPFFMGGFTRKMFEFDWNRIKSYMIAEDNTITNFLNTPIKPYETPIKLNSLWDMLYSFTKYEITGVEGIGLKLIYTRQKKIMPVFYKKYLMQDRLRQVTETTPINKLTIGENIVDMSVSLDANNIFNEVKFKVENKVIDNYDNNTIYSFPFDKVSSTDSNTSNYVKTILRAMNNDLDVKRTVDLMREDYLVYGPNTYPVVKTLIHGNILKNLDDTGEFLSRHGYGGLTGELLTVGNDFIMPDTLILIRDGRKSFLDQLKENGLIKKAGDILGQKIPVPTKLTSVADSVKNWFTSNGQTAGITNWYKTDRLIDNIFFVWKVRHYVGPEYGYRTKVYFQEQPRFDEVRFSKEVSGMINAALGRTGTKSSV